MSQRNGPVDREPPGDRDLLDAYFDGELDSAGKGRLHEALCADAVLAEEFSRTSEAVSMLRQSASNAGLATDLTDGVLARCEVRERLLSKRGRRFVLAGRSAVALATLAIVAGLVVWVRLTPPQLRLAEHERPLGVLLEGSNRDAAQMRLVPPAVQQDLADSVDQSKAHGTIVFHLEPDSAASFAAIDDPASSDRAEGFASPRREAMARLPLFARPHDIEAQRAAAARLGPMPMAQHSAASVVRGQASATQSWWGRSGTSSPTSLRVYIGEYEDLLFIRPKPDADRARE